MSALPRARHARRSIVVVTSLLVSTFFGWVALVPFPAEALRHDALTSTRVLDRSGHLLREVLSSEDARGRWTPLTELSPNLVLATIQAEDRRFEDHAGMDVLATLRALWLAATHGEARTGASTITQQLVKLTLQRGLPRTLPTKLMEVVWAWRLELALSKDEILEQYLNRVPYGNQLIGAEAASWMYLGKPASQLSLAEASFLAGLPNSPTHLNPYRNLERARARQRWLIDLMRTRGAIDLATWQTAVFEPLLLRPRRGPIEAPHLTRRAAALVLSLPPELRPATLWTTLDLQLQRDVERLLRAQAPEDATRGRFQAAAVVLDTASSEVLAWVGARDFADGLALGENDGVTALRQPGSALKPFVYALLFEQGAPYDTVLDDRPMSFSTPAGPYRPENYDHMFHGEVTVRTALGSSLNLPAVATLEQVGVAKMLALLRRLGLSTLSAAPDHYGLGLALGNGEVRLLDLAGAYATLGRLGRHLPVRWLKTAATTLSYRSRPCALRKSSRKSPTSFETGSGAPGRDLPVPPDRGVRVLSEETSFVLLDMLADDRARGIGFGLAGPFELPFRLAAKTGTSSDFRDNWAVAVTPRHTIAVWVGNFDGRPMQRKPGRSGAAPLLRQIAQILYPQASDPGALAWFPTPSTLVRRGQEWVRR